MSQNQSSATACRLCELSGQFNCDSKKEDPIEKVLNIIKAVYLPWGEEPVRCEDLKSHGLWEKLSTEFLSDFLLLPDLVYVGGPVGLLLEALSMLEDQLVLQSNAKTSYLG